MFSETPPIQPIRPDYHIRILSDEQLEQFRAATFEILMETGIQCPSERALRIYAENGAEVDFETQIVKIPPDVVLEALSHAATILHHGRTLGNLRSGSVKRCSLRSNGWNRDQDDRLCHPRAALLC